MGGAGVDVYIDVHQALWLVEIEIIYFPGHEHVEDDVIGQSGAYKRAFAIQLSRRSDDGNAAEELALLRVIVMGLENKRMKVHVDLPQHGTGAALAVPLLPLLAFQAAGHRGFAKGIVIPACSGLKSNGIAPQKIRLRAIQLQ